MVQVNARNKPQEHVKKKAHSLLARLQRQKYQFEQITEPPTITTIIIIIVNDRVCVCALASALEA